jgi:nucleotide-binding universal stress UspA family protein
MILICYDGSDDAKAAIAQAQTLFAGKSAVVLNVWEPFVDILVYTPGVMAGVADVEKIDEASRANAAQVAAEGAALARDGGLDATPQAVTRKKSVAQTILAQADAADAEAIVLGSRGLTGIASLLLGSVSHAVLQSSDRPVLTVPSTEVAEKRRESRHADVHQAA